MNATTVAANHPMTEMMRARRRSSRCSTIDIRPSGLRFCEDAGRPLSFRAIAGWLALLLGLGLAVGGRGRSRGGLGRVLLVERRPHLGGDVVGGLAELPDPASHRTT